MAVVYDKDTPVSAPVVLTSVATLIGSNTKDLGTLCTQGDKIAIWNVCKPTNITSVVGVTGAEKISQITSAERAAAAWSLVPFTLTGVTYSEFISQLRTKLSGATALEKTRGLVAYNVPSGGEADSYRLADFINYVHGLGNSASSHAGDIVLNFMPTTGYIDEIDASSAGTVQTYDFSQLVDGNYPTSGELTVPWLLKMYFERILGISSANSMTHVYYANGHIAITGETLPIKEVIEDLGGSAGSVEQYEFYSNINTLNSTNKGIFVFIPGGSDTAVMKISHNMNLGSPTFDGFDTTDAKDRLDFILSLTNNISSINGLTSWAKFASAGLKCKMFISLSATVPDINTSYATGDVIYVKDLTTDSNWENSLDFQTRGYDYWEGNDWTDADEAHYIHIVYQWLNSELQTATKSKTVQIICINPVSA